MRVSTAAVASLALRVAANDHSRYVGALIAFVIGMPEILYAWAHCFYPGWTSSGIAMLVLITTVIGFLAVPRALVDLIGHFVVSNVKLVLRNQHQH